MKLSKFSVLGGLVAIALSAGAYSVISKPVEEPVFVDGQFTATLDQKSQHWRLLPIDGQDVEVFSPERQCGIGAPIPAGIWLVTRDSNGRPELLAPSVTALPDGYADRVHLRACGEATDGRPALEVPQILIDVLAERTVAIYVNG